MTDPVPITTRQDVSNCVGSCRFMIQQIKEKQGQKVLAYRQIDHLTESLINPTTRTYEILENDTSTSFSTSFDYYFLTALSCVYTKRTSAGPSAGSLSKSNT